MHKFHLVACFAGLLAVQSFAQPRDLFAEFEAEAEAAQSSETVVSSSSAAVSSSSVAPSSSSVASSSSVVASSSSVAPLSSSAEVSSSSAPADTAAPVVADTTAPADSIASTAPADSAAGDSAIADSAKPMTPEEAYAAEMRRLSEENRIRDSLAALSSSSSEQPAPDISSSSMSRRDLLGPVKVSKVYGIDDMKGRYKSPRKALFMSLVVPGSGQLYVGGSTFTYVRGGAYLALEAALWGSWAYFSVYKYNDQVKKYKKFAREHYSIGRYEAGMRELVGQLSDETEESRFETRYMNSRESFCEAIYGNASSAGCYTANRLFYNDKSHYDRFSVGNPTSLENEIESVGSFYDGSAVYQQIADRAYVLGWDDVEEPAVAMNLELEDDEPSDGIVPLAKSSNMDEYRSMRSKANDYADLQVWFFGGLILNHIVSAIDAAFTANAHNKTLYSEELSWYDRLHFDSYVSIFNGLDVGVQASWGF
ncbi:MAG: hypothetical protein IJ177_03105 [Fibrobacter sp.]|uniref:DUF5683 domain-containing protein n=1 Tax=Fibrobacter sp. TaxID=35828 RepID=UPI0025C4B9AA|nr:DUF5683 domain-containing protein [Fibrobacter sp.]MBQ9225162.1 hypothetical protein [Fibrobacter sp.]